MNVNIDEVLNVTYCSAGLNKFSNSYARVHGYISMAVCQFGGVMNVLNIWVLTRREMRSPTNAILTALAIADLLVMLDYMPYAWHVHLSPAQRLDKHKFSYNWTCFVLFHSFFSQVILKNNSISLLSYFSLWQEHLSEK